MSRRPRLYYGGETPEGDPPIPEIFKHPHPPRSKEMLRLDAEYARKRLEAQRAEVNAQLARLEAESTRLDIQEQKLLELEEEIEGFTE